MFNSDLRISEGVEPGTWELIAGLMYEGERDTFVIAPGYVTDFASVPRFLHWLIAPYGAYTKAAIVHDWLITDGIPEGLVTSRDADGIFRRIMREEGVPFVKRWVMWAAVRAAAGFNPKRAPGRALLRDLPAVVGIGVLALPFILPGALGVLVSLVLVKPFTWGKK